MSTNLSLDRWVGKVAVVTGASVGIGATIAEELVKAGLIVVGLARRKELIEDLAKKLSNCPGKLHALKVDVGKKNEIEEAFKWIRENVGVVHILVNNAGIVRSATLGEGDVDQHQEVININVMGVAIATREAVIMMKANHVDGHIIHINSIAGHEIVCSGKLNMYYASKFAVTAMAECLRQEFNSSDCKIKITSISPGFVDTDILKIGATQEMIDDFQQANKLQSKDIADALVYVLSTPPNVLISELKIRPVQEKFV